MMKPLLAFCAGALLLAVPAVALAQPPQHANQQASSGQTAEQARFDRDRDGDRDGFGELRHMARFCDDGDRGGGNDDRGSHDNGNHNGGPIGHGRCHHEHPHSP
jgi:hypothetical protein